MDFYALGRQDALLKFAAIFGASEPDADLDSIPYHHRRGELTDYLNEKSNEKPTSWLKSIGGGALGGGLLGGIVGALTGHPGSVNAGALIGGGIGGGLGGLTGGLMSAADRRKIQSAKDTLQQGPRAIDKRMRDNVRSERSWDGVNKFLIDQNRHNELLGELRRNRDEGY